MTDHQMIPEEVEADLIKCCKELVDAYLHLEIMLAISDSDELFVAARALENHTVAFPDLADAFIETMRKLALEDWNIARAIKRRDAGLPAQGP